MDEKSGDEILLNEKVRNEKIRNEDLLTKNRRSKSAGRNTVRMRFKANRGKQRSKVSRVLFEFYSDIVRLEERGWPSNVDLPFCCPKTVISVGFLVLKPKYLGVFYHVCAIIGFHSPGNVIMFNLNCFMI